MADTVTSPTAVLNPDQTDQVNAPTFGLAIDLPPIDLPILPPIDIPPLPIIGPGPILPNAPPVASSQSISLTENSQFSGVLEAFDLEGDSLSFAAIEGPRNGRVTIQSNGNFTYIPNADFDGDDSFTFRANDGGLLPGVPAEVSITVQDRPNTAPVANDQTVSTAEDVALTGVLTGSDRDGDPLTFAKLSDPSNGRVTIQGNGNFTYTPDADFDGDDSFTFRVNDGEANSTAATVSVTVVSDGIAEIRPEAPGATATGTQGADQLIGLSGDERLVGLGGNDIIDGLGGADTMEGGPGDDRYIVDDAGDRVIELTAEGFDRVSLTADLGNFQTPENIEQVVLLDGVTAATPADTGTKLAGVGDNNTFFSGPGTDFYDGNDGRDTLTYENATAGVSASLLKPTAFNTGGAGTDKIDDIEILVGSDFDDVLVGAQGVSNRIRARDGDDIIVGFAGPDVLRGGPGEDTFLYNRLSFRDSEFGGGEDVIQDFRNGVDTLDLSRLGVDFEDLTIVNGRLDADVDGDGTLDFGIIFENNVRVMQEDIIV